MIAVRFASKEDETALADDPVQDAFHQRHLGPDVEDIRWIDGSWERRIQAGERT